MFLISILSNEKTLYQYPDLKANTLTVINAFGVSIMLWTMTVISSVYEKKTLCLKRKHECIKNVNHLFSNCQTPWL